ncbi:hypothetical protein H2248_003058 [Termitomyces sp. 'cryptogamus']|nr:hypothetical protein H2248_003058 [Termitomyces sp. 'cryptogamus']
MVAQPSFGRHMDLHAFHRHRDIEYRKGMLPSTVIPLVPPTFAILDLLHHHSRLLHSLVISESPAFQEQAASNHGRHLMRVIRLHLKLPIIIFSTAQTSSLPLGRLRLEF